MANKRTILVAAVVLCALVGAIIGVVVWQSGSESTSTSKGDNNTSENAEGGDAAGGDTSKDTTDGGNNAVDSEEGTESSGSGTTNDSDDKSKITSDPTKEAYSVAAFAVGDWGTTLNLDSCCKRREKYTNTDVHAEDIVAALMDKQVANQELKPKVIMGHGDSFYWTGINGMSDQEGRFETTFESKFSGASLMDIPWVNVMGNHDYGGASFICSSGGTYVKCKSPEELVAGLEEKFQTQQSYVSTNNNRWIMEDRFFVHSIGDKSSNVTIDIFNIDTNDADTHGLQQICCQCYGYSEGSKKCKNVIRGEPFCAGGSTEMYDACDKKLQQWADESREQLIEKAKASTATFKIVNTHYSPYNHYTPENMNRWFEALDGIGVHLWMNGHTHGEKHDYSPKLKMHFVENGAGGGIASESASGIPPYAEDTIQQFWTYAGEEYGFFSLQASPEWLMIKYHSYPRGWVAPKNFKAGDITEVEVHHCWYIPVDGSKGRVCDESLEYPPLHSAAKEE